MFFIRYKHSLLATVVSALGAAFGLGGICFWGSALGIIDPSQGAGSVQENIMIGILFVAIGIAMMFVASKIAARKEAKYQKKMKEKAAKEADGILVPQKKPGVGKIIGIVLIILQVIAIVFSIYQGNPIWVQARYQPAASAMGLYLGYFLPTIIGVILIIRGNKKASSASYSAAKKVHICPKCGAKVEEGESFCIHCGSPIRK